MNEKRISQAYPRKPRAILGIAAVLAFAFSAMLSATGPAVASEVDGLSVPSLSAEENGLLNSGEPITVTIDPATGEVTRVEETQIGIEPFGVTKNNCSGGKACWYGWLSPHAYYGFNGTGATGTWPNRGNFYSGSYNAKPCWLVGSSTVCTEVYLPPATTSVFGVELTGKRVYLS